MHRACLDFGLGQVVRIDGSLLVPAAGPPGVTAIVALLMITGICLAELVDAEFTDHPARAGAWQLDATHCIPAYPQWR